MGLSGPADPLPRAAKAEPPDRPPLVANIAGLVLVVLVCLAALALVFRSGAYGPADWLPFLIGLAALAIVMGVSGPSLFASRYQKALLGLFAAQAVWTAASLFWAGSRANAWEETNRTLLYAVVVALIFAAVRWTGSRGLKTLVGLLTTAVTLVAVVILVRLGVTQDPMRFFLTARLNYPVTYFNGLAALLMIGFWLALCTANAAGGRPRTDARAADGRRTAAVLLRAAQPVLLVACVLLLETGLLPQSRGALWAFVLVIPFFVALSPNRFRALADLALVTLPMVLFWGRLNHVFITARDSPPGLRAALDGALHAVGYSVLIVLGCWLVTWMVERLIGPLSKRVTLWIGAALAVVVLVCAVGGIVYADHRTGGLGGYLSTRWNEFTSDKDTTGVSGNRFVAVGLDRRLGQWKVAIQAFETEPLRGIGAQNFELYYDQHRTTPFDSKQPHSQPIQLLAELGVPGLLLWLAFVALTLGYGVVLRFRSSGRATQAVIAAAVVTVVYWFIHSSADWLWQLAGVSVPALMLLGGLAGGGPAATRPRGRRHPVAGTVARGVVAVLGVVVMVSAALPYVSLQYSQLAARTPNLDTALARTRTAAALDRTSIQPYAVRANAYQVAASSAPAASSARVQALALAGEAWVEAAGREPAYWLCYYKAAEAFLAARNAALSAGVPADQLGKWAEGYLADARKLNPLAPQVDKLQEAF